MSVATMFDRFINHKFILYSFILTFLLCWPPLGHADSPGPVPAEDEVGELTMDELRVQADTIREILATASQRVDELAVADTDTPALMDAIRQEISLSRRWNDHLGAILQEVAKAQRELGDREREAAKEIVRMTAIAEEARLELVALKNVLKGQPVDTQQDGDHGPNDASHDQDQTDAGGPSMPQSSLAAAVTEAISDPTANLDEARAALVAMQEAQADAFHDVDAVRTKIIDALETLAAARGESVSLMPDADESLSSQGITAWAASTATKLNRTSRGGAD